MSRRAPRTIAPARCASACKERACPPRASGAAPRAPPARAPFDAILAWRFELGAIGDRALECGDGLRRVAARIELIDRDQRDLHVAVGRSLERRRAHRARRRATAAREAPRGGRARPDRAGPSTHVRHAGPADGGGAHREPTHLRVRIRRRAMLTISSSSAFALVKRLEREAPDSGVAQQLRPRPGSAWRIERLEQLDGGGPGRSRRPVHAKERFQAFRDAQAIGRDRGWPTIRARRWRLSARSMSGAALVRQARDGFAQRRADVRVGLNVQPRDERRLCAGDRDGGAGRCLERPEALRGLRDRVRGFGADFRQRMPQRRENVGNQRRAARVRPSARTAMRTVSGRVLRVPLLRIDEVARRRGAALFGLHDRELGSPASTARGRLPVRHALIPTHSKVRETRSIPGAYGSAKRPRRRRVLEHLRGQIARIRDLHVGDLAVAAVVRLELRHHEAGVRRQVQLIDARDDLVAQLRIEVHAVGLEQRLRRRRSRLRALMRCTSASSRPTPSRNACASIIT